MRDELGDDGGRFFRFPQVILDDEVNLSAEDAAVVVDLLGGELLALNRSLPEGGLGTARGGVDAHWNITRSGGSLSFGTGTAAQAEDRCNTQRKQNDPVHQGREFISERIYHFMQANDIRRGIVIVFNGDLCKVMEFNHHTPGNLRAMVQAKLRNMRTGNQFEHRFRSQDEITQAYINQHEMEYLYSDGHAHHFMNTENYEQVEISEEDLGDSASWLNPGVKLQVQFYEEKPIGIELPKTLRVRIAETEPQVRGATASASYKPAKLENGVTVLVPPFVSEGEEIIVDPSENRYLERAKKE